MNVIERLALVRSALYLPASNARAVAKAQGLGCDLVILDLEDSVKPEDKAMAREAAVAALSAEWRAKLVVIRANGPDSAWHAEDVAALKLAGPDLVVVPKVEWSAEAAAVADAVGVAVLAMIETPRGIYEARAIAETDGVAGLIAGTNDLAHDLGLPPGSGRGGLALSLQSIVLAARVAGGVAFDGVYNRLDDAEGFATECREGRALGFDGKTLIHPNQVDPCNALFGPDAAEVEDARAIIEAATGGAERFRGRMIETMHVATARRLLARAES